MDNDQDLTLHVHDDGDFLLPSAIFDTTLSLEEIGVIALLRATIDGWVDPSHPRLTAPETQSAMEKVKALGIVAAKLDGDTIKVAIDLEKVMPAD